MEEKYLTVTALTKYIKYKFDNDRHLREVLLAGEISNFKRHSRGHFYFTLKDEGSQISAMMFSSNASKVPFQPKDGMKVFIKGTVTVYEASGYYQITVSQMKNDGIGDLYLAYEALKKELEESGIFDYQYKKPIPRFPKAIGVVTSPTGAAIRDIINTISRRYPMTKLILYPALVQGVDAKNSIVEQINLANEQRLVDTLIVGRGGGSIEDLWAFNEKIVAQAIFDSKIPIISAVGHEVDFTIADFVADMRAATPTAAAELATPNLEILKQNIMQYVNILNKGVFNCIENYKMLIANLDKHLESNNPIEKLLLKRRQADDLTKNLRLLINNVLDYKKHQYGILNEKMKALNPLAIMEKGYSIAKVKNQIIRSIQDVQPEDELNITVNDGIIKTKVLEVAENGKG